MSTKLIIGLACLATVALFLLTVFWLDNPLPVEFADPNLEQLVREVLDKPEGDISRGELQHIYSLDARDRDIRRLDGIEYAGNLQSLDLEDNRVVDVSPLAGLGNLEVLSLRNNGITDLEAIGFCEITDLPLRELSLRHNVLDEAEERPRLADISLLAEFTGLEVLELRDNAIEDIAPLAGLTKLRELDISQNPLQDGDISALAGLTELAVLNLRETGLKSVATVANFPGLRYLNIHSNPELDSIAPLAGLTELETLIMRNVPVGEEIYVLEGMTRLTRLNLRNTGVKDLQPLVDLMKLGALQDKPELRIEATLDLRDNLISVWNYNLLCPYWLNISNFDVEIDKELLPRPSSGEDG